MWHWWGYLEGKEWDPGNRNVSNRNYFKPAGFRVMSFMPLIDLGQERASLQPFSSRLPFSPNPIYSLTTVGKTEEIAVIRIPPVACPVCFFASTETRRIPTHTKTYKPGENISGRYFMSRKGMDKK